MKTSVINQIKTLLGMSVKLEQKKMADGVTLIEADEFATDNEVFVVTEDEQKIPVPIGEYEMEDGFIMSVVEEGIIAEYKEKEKEEEVVEEEAKSEKGYEEEDEKMQTEKTPMAKKTIESSIKETFFSEIENLQKENIELKAKLELLTKVDEVAVEATELADIKPIAHNPENNKEIDGVKYAKNKTRTMLDVVLEKIYK